MTHLFKRGKFWQITYKKDGKRYWRSLGLKTKRAAEVARARIEIELAQGKSPQVVGLSLNRLIVHYLRYCEVHNAPSTLYTKKIYVRRFLKFFDDAVTSITRADVEKYLRRPAGTPTLNRELATLRHLFNLAVEWGKLEKNPASGVKFLPEVRKPLKLPSPEDLATWLSWCRENDTLLCDLSVVALNTGLRKGDILKIKKADIDFKRRLLAVSVSKTRAVQYVPLNDAALEVLRRNSEGVLVFPICIKRRFRKALLETGLKFRFHDFRHLFATEVIKNADARTVQGLLGHAKITTTERYLALLDERQRQAVENLWGK